MSDLPAPAAPTTAPKFLPPLSLQKARTDDGVYVANAKTSVRRVGNRLSTNRVVLPSFKSSLRVSVSRREPAQPWLSQENSDGQNLISHLCITISSRVNILGPKVEINPTIVGISRSIFDSWNFTDPKLDNLRCVSPETGVSAEPAAADAEQLQQMTDDLEPNAMVEETQTVHPDKSRFVKVKPSGMKAVAAGFGHSMVLTKDDSLWATGWNLYGQFGDGSITSTSNFIRVAKLSDIAVHDAVAQTQNFSPSDLSVTTMTSASGESPSLSVSWCSVQAFFTLCCAYNIII